MTAWRVAVPDPETGAVRKCGEGGRSRGGRRLWCGARGAAGGNRRPGNRRVAVTGARIWKSPQREWVDRTNGSTRAKLLGA